AITALQADVLSIENSKSDAKLLKVFVDEAYPRHIGPGVYDIHSPRIPSEQEIKDRIARCCSTSSPDSCGSTRTAGSRPVGGPRPSRPSPTWSTPPGFIARSTPSENFIDPSQFNHRLLATIAMVKNTGNKPHN